MILEWSRKKFPFPSTWFRTNIITSSLISQQDFWVSHYSRASVVLDPSTSLPLSCRWTKFVVNPDSKRLVGPFNVQLALFGLHFEWLRRLPIVWKFAEWKNKTESIWRHVISFLAPLNTAEMLATLVYSESENTMRRNNSARRPMLSILKASSIFAKFRNFKTDSGLELRGRGQGCWHVNFLKGKGARENIPRPRVEAKHEFLIEEKEKNVFFSLMFFLPWFPWSKSCFHGWKLITWLIYWLNSIIINFTQILAPKFQLSQYRARLLLHEVDAILHTW